MKRSIITAILVLILSVASLTQTAGASESPVQDKDVVKELTQQFDFHAVDKPTKALPLQTQSVLSQADKLQTDIILTRERNKFLSIAFILVALMVSLFCVLHFIRKTRHGAEDIVHASGLVLIIFGTIIIVLMVDVEQQLTAAIGIMGAIAGYIFGTMHRGKEEKTTSPPDGSG